MLPSPWSMASHGDFQGAPVLAYPVQRDCEAP